MTKSVSNAPQTANRNKPTDWKTATGHQVLAAAGKKMLRPGGRAATEQLLEWGDFQPGETVLELACSFGYSAIALAQRYGVQVTGIEKNPESVARARANVAAAGLSDRITILEGDIFHLDQLTEKFDYVLAEAILTMQSPSGKAKILAGVSDRLKPGGEFLSHELRVQNQSNEITAALRQAIRVNATPLSTVDWQAACASAGLQVTQTQIGPMALLNPQSVLQDEGWVDSLKMIWNVLTRPPIRQRVLEMYRIFQRYADDLGYIVLSAQKSE